MCVYKTAQNDFSWLLPHDKSLVCKIFLLYLPIDMVGRRFNPCRTHKYNNLAIVELALSTAWSRYVLEVTLTIIETKYIKVNS
jgi:hypothetical protein